jgi:hypothetical protein
MGEWLKHCSANISYINFNNEEQNSSSFFCLYRILFIYLHKKKLKLKIKNER